MATTNFTDNVTKVLASWLNEVDAVVHNVFGAATTAVAARQALEEDIAVEVKSAGFSPTTGDRNKIYYCTAALTVTPISAVTLTGDFLVTVIAKGADVVFDPSGAETVSGSATYTVTDGSSVRFISDGTNWVADVGHIPATVTDGYVPIGSVFDYAGTTAPTGYLLCFGQTLDSVTDTEYAALYTAIGHSTFGGTGADDFNLPDVRGRVVAGQDDMGGSSANRLTAAATGGVNGDTLGGTGGEEAHTLLVDGMPSHAHTGEKPAAPVNTFDSTAATGAVTGTAPETTSSAGGGNPHNNVQPTLIMNKIIRYA